MSAAMQRHGGPDARGAARWDFSTCSNAAGPCPPSLQAVQQADATRYPDPESTALREALAALHGVAPRRILVAASASEFIQRITAVGAQLRPGPVAMPLHAYGDYSAAASAWQRGVIRAPLQTDAQADTQAHAQATLRWCADPSSPTGQANAAPAAPGDTPTVLDAAYAPLRLEGASAWSAAERDEVFVLHSPNKALGLCGVRGAYAVAPRAAAWDVEAWCDALEAAAPSWPLSAHAHAMVFSWTQPATQAWLASSFATLRTWKSTLADALSTRGFEWMPSQTPFFCARPPQGVTAAQLRALDVAVRDAGSFGLRGWWRVSAQPPAAIDAFINALRTIEPGAAP